MNHNSSTIESGANIETIVKSNKKSKWKRKETWQSYLFLLPSLIGFTIFLIIPTIGSLVMSFLKWDLITPPEFIGLQNYQTLIADDLFWTVLKNTLYFSVGTIPIGMGIAFLIAVMLNQKLRATNFYRSIFFLPVMASTAACAIIWRWIFEKDFGLLNYFLSWFGIDGPAWLTNTSWAMPAVIIMSLWKHLGFDMVIFLAALQGVSKELYEASDIDGAKPWQKMRYISIPLISYSTFFILIMNIIRSFQVFDQMFVLTGGGPGYSTQVLVYYIYTNAFQYFKMGYAASIAWVLFIIVFIITILQLKLQNKWVHYK
jgi:multiple sugar transport system permease protein